MTLHIYTDGGSRGNPGDSAIGGVVFKVFTDNLDQKVEVHSFAEYLGVGTNNEAEYTAVLRSLEWVVQFEELRDVTEICWFLDSQLVVNQLNKTWKIKEPRMATLAHECWKKLTQLSKKTSFRYVPRAQNKQADALVNQALDARTLE